MLPACSRPFVLVGLFGCMCCLPLPVAVCVVSTGLSLCSLCCRTLRACKGGALAVCVCESAWICVLGTRSHGQLRLLLICSWGVAAGAFVATAA